MEPSPQRIYVSYSRSDGRAFAEAGGLMPKLDHLTVLRCVQVVRRLLLKNRDIGLFCNVAGMTLADAGFPQLLEFAEANRAIAPSLLPARASGRSRTATCENARMSTSNSDGEPITEAGLAALKAELGELETVARREIAERILVARGHGDLKENAEYHAAKEDQAHLETRILRLRDRLRKAVVVESTAANGDTFALLPLRQASAPGSPSRSAAASCAS